MIRLSNGNISLYPIAGTKIAAPHCGEVKTKLDQSRREIAEGHYTTRQPQ